MEVIFVTQSLYPKQMIPQVCGFQSRPILLAKKNMMTLPGTDLTGGPVQYHFYCLGVCIDYKVHYKK